MSSLQDGRSKRQRPPAGVLPSLRTVDVYAEAANAQVAPGTCVDPDLKSLVEPMLASVIALAGATAGTLRLIGSEGAPGATLVAVGPGSESGSDPDAAFQAWCGACDEARHADSACVQSRLCRHEQEIPADALGPVCKHVVAVPLRHAGRPVGAVHLMFERECDLPPAMAPLLRATGDLLGLTLENARLARENLRISLMTERQRMANEVHDSLAQGLTYMRMRMSLLRDAVRQGDEGRMIKLCADVDEALGGAHHRLRELILYFRSRMDPRGLHHALAEAADAFRDRAGVTLDYVNRMQSVFLPAAREIEVFHIVQEALANVTRHAGARHVRLALACEAGECRVTIEDDGVGIGQAVAAGDRAGDGHFGVAIMQERARRLGGDLAIVPLAARGTSVRLRFPVTAPAEAPAS